MSNGGKKNGRKSGGRVTPKKLSQATNLLRPILTQVPIAVNPKPSTPKIMVNGIQTDPAEVTQIIQNAMIDWIRGAQWLRQNASLYLQFIEECNINGLVIDLASGNSLFTQLMSKTYPETTYIGIDPDNDQFIPTKVIDFPQFQNFLTYYMTKFLDPDAELNHELLQKISSNPIQELIDAPLTNVFNTRVQGAVPNIPLRNNFADAITCFTAFRYMPDIASFFRDTSSKLKVNGELIFDTHNPIFNGLQEIWQKPIRPELLDDPEYLDLLSNASAFGHEAVVLQAFFIEAHINGLELTTIARHKLCCVDTLNEELRKNGVFDLIELFEKDPDAQIETIVENGLYSPMSLYYKFVKKDHPIKVTAISDIVDVLFSQLSIYDFAELPRLEVFEVFEANTVNAALVL